MNAREFSTCACAFALILACMLRPSATRSEVLATPGEGDRRIRVAPYSAEQVYRLYAFVGYEIVLEFEPGETFQGAAGGDLEGLSYGTHANFVSLKPKAINHGANLTIFTDRRHYHFDYSASARRPDPLLDEVIYSLRFTYPPPRDTTAQSARAAVDPLAQPTTPRPHNIDYWYCGHPSLRPVAASDDGVHTRLTFASTGELPAIFVRNADGTESLLNFSMDASDVVIHRVAQRFIVRRGRLTGCIVNQAFNGSSDRLESQTLSPTVERATRRSSP